MMHRTTVSVLAVLCVAVALSGVAYAGVHYVEDFGPGDAGNVSTAFIGWSNYVGATAVDMSDAETGNPRWYVYKTAAGSTGGYLIASTTDDSTYDFLGLTVTSEPGSVSTGLLESISFRPKFNSGDAEARIAVEIGGNWYATDDTFTDSANSWSTPAVTFNWTNTASAWRDLTFIPTIIVDEVPVPGELSLGGTASADLSGNVTQFGLYADYTTTDWMRFDDFTINDNIPAMPGNANCDDTVDAADAADLAANWLRDDVDVGWADGDFNGDFKVDGIDATLLATNWNWQKQASVPEPATPVLIAIALAFLSLVRISRRK